MEDSLLGKYLQRPQSLSTEPMEFQFLPGPSSKGKALQGAATSISNFSEATSRPSARPQPAQTSESLMPPPCIPARNLRNIGREVVKSWEQQSSDGMILHDQTPKLSPSTPGQVHRPIQQQQLKRRSVTLGDITPFSQEDHGKPEGSRNTESEPSSIDQVSNSRVTKSAKYKATDDISSHSNLTERFGFGLLDAGFEIPIDASSSAQKMNNNQTTPKHTELSATKIKKTRPLEFYETPLAKQIEARLNELNGLTTAMTKDPPEVIDLSDDDMLTVPPTSEPQKPSQLLKPGVMYTQSKQVIAPQSDYKSSASTKDINRLQVNDSMSPIIDFPNFDDMNYPSTRKVIENPSSSRKVGNLPPRPQYQLRGTGHYKEDPSSRRMERAHFSQSRSTQGTVTPQPNSLVLQSSIALQKAIAPGELPLEESLVPILLNPVDKVPMSGEQQLSIALTQLTSEKTALEKKFNRISQECITKSAELLNLQAENCKLKYENEKHNSVIKTLKVQFSKIQERVKDVGSCVLKLGGESIQLKASVSNCIDEAANIKVDVQSLHGNVAIVGSKFEQSSSIMRDLERQRDEASSTVNLLKTELSDYVGELALARERVSALETLLDRAAQRAAQEKENAMNTLSSIESNCTSRFEELQMLLKSILHVKQEAIDQKKDTSRSLTALINSQVNSITAKTNNIESSLTNIRTEMKQCEKRTRRAIVIEGLRVVDKVVNTTDALEKIIGLECKGVTKMVEDCLTVCHGLNEDFTKQPGSFKSIQEGLESLEERVTSIFTETKEMHDLAITDNQNISQFKINNEWLLEQLKQMEGNREELGILTTEKFQVEKELSQNRERCDQMEKEIDSLKIIGNERLQSAENLKKQLEDVLAQPKENPETNTVIMALRSNIETLEANIESLRETIAEKDQQLDVRGRHFNDLTAEFQNFKKLNDDRKEEVRNSQEEKRRYEARLRSLFEEEKENYIRQLLEERNAERIAVEKSAQKLCDKIRAEAQNSVKMIGADNTKLFQEVSLLKQKITECEQETLGHVQEVSKLRLHIAQISSQQKGSDEQAREHDLLLSTLQSEKTALVAKLEAARDLVQHLENELETLRTCNLEEKLNLADLEVLSLKDHIEKMQKRMEMGTGCLNSALNAVLTNSERGEVNRSLEDAIYEVQLLCEGLKAQPKKEFIDNGTCMIAHECDVVHTCQEQNNARTVTMMKDENIKHNLEGAPSDEMANETPISRIEMGNITLVANTPPAGEAILGHMSNSSVARPQLIEATGMRTSNTEVEPMECVPATQVPTAKPQARRRIKFVVGRQESTSYSSSGDRKTLEMAVGEPSSPITASMNLQSPRGEASVNTKGSGIVPSNIGSPANSKKRARIESHDPPLISTPAGVVIPPRTKRPRNERATTTHIEVNGNELEKNERTGAGNVLRGNEHKDNKASSVKRAPSPLAAGPKRKRAPNKRGMD